MKKSKGEKLVEDYGAAIALERHQAEQWMDFNQYAEETAYRVKKEKALLRYIKKLEVNQK